MLGRRDVLLGALGVVCVSACDVDDLRPPEDDRSPSAGATPTTASPSTPPATDPDTTLVDRVVTDIIGAAVAVEGARLLPRLRRALGPLERMHLAHLAVLDGELEGPQPVRPASLAAGLEQVRTAEQTLQVSLVAAALEARSGALARVLASMSASLSQHLALLPAATTDGEPA